MYGMSGFLRAFLLCAACCLLLPACKSRPEYREPDAGEPHGVLTVKPLADEKGGGLRSIDGKLVFPRDCEPGEMHLWKYRSWRIHPGMRKVEIFALGNTLSRTVRVENGKKYSFVPEKYVDSATSGKDLEVHNYVLNEE